MNAVLSKQKLSNDPGLTVILYVMLIGFGAIFLLCLSGEFKYFLLNLSLSLAVGVASSLVGGFIGFLFGIPKSLQRANDNDSVLELSVSSKEKARYYSNNTNLEQISDWLTKIIVGVSLTQIPLIISSFDKLVSGISISMHNGVIAKYAYAFIGSIILLYALCGFLAGYIYGKIHLLKQLVEMEGNLYQDLMVKQESRINKIEKRQLLNTITEFKRTTGLVEEVESRDSEIASIISVAKPDPVKFPDDCQKGRWGGMEQTDRYVAKATIQKVKQSSFLRYNVHIELSAKSGNQLLGKVYFFLHDSFYPEMILINEAIEDVAKVDFDSYEAFTVGIVFNNGNERLELDLKKAQVAPDVYRYVGDLITIDEINEKLKEYES